MIHTLVVLGSPRKDGNSELAARAVADILHQHHQSETEYIRLAPLRVKPCIGCGSCEKTGECILQDKMTDLYPKVDRADIILIASPTYFYGLSAQTKAFVDRIQARWSRKYILQQSTRLEDKRRGYLICSAATHGKKLFDGSVLTAKSFFDAIDVSYGGELLLRGVDEKGAIQTAEGKMQQVNDFALDIVREFSG